MADTKTSDEAAATTPTGAELVRITQGGSSKRTTAAVLGHQFRGAKARMTLDDTLVNPTSGYIIPFDSTDFDTDSFWSAGSPSRLTIPAGKGIKYVELVGQVSATLGTVSTWAGVIISHRNSAGTLLEQFLNHGWDYGTGHLSPAITGPVAVSDGDYFELIYQEESDTSVTIDGDHAQRRTYLALTVIGMIPV